MNPHFATRLVLFGCFSHFLDENLASFFFVPSQTRQPEIELANKKKNRFFFLMLLTSIFFFFFVFGDPSGVAMRFFLLGSKCNTAIYIYYFKVSQNEAEVNRSLQERRTMFALHRSSSGVLLRF